MTREKANIEACRLAQLSKEDDEREAAQNALDGESPATEAETDESLLLTALRAMQETGMAIRGQLVQGPNMTQATWDEYEGTGLTDGVFTLGETTVTVQNHSQSVPLLSELKITGSRDYRDVNRITGSMLFTRWFLAKQAEAWNVPLLSALLKLNDKQLSEAASVIPVYSTSGEFYAYLDVCCGAKTFANQGLQVKELASMMSDYTEFLIETYFAWDKIKPGSLTFHETPCYVAPVQRVSIAERAAKRAAERAARAARAERAERAATLEA